MRSSARQFSIELGKQSWVHEIVEHGVRKWLRIAVSIMVSSRNAREIMEREYRVMQSTERHDSTLPRSIQMTLRSEASSSKFLRSSQSVSQYGTRVKSERERSFAVQ